MKFSIFIQPPSPTPFSVTVLPERVTKSALRHCRKRSVDMDRSSVWEHESAYYFAPSAVREGISAFCSQKFSRGRLCDCTGSPFSDITPQSPGGAFESMENL